MNTLTLAGRKLRCIDGLPPGLLFDMADAQAQGETMKTVSAMRKLLVQLVIEEDRPLLNEALYDSKNVLPMTEIYEGINKLVEEMTGRPTRRPSRSQPGGEPTAKPAKVVSFSKGTVKEEPASRKGGRQAVS
jgi:hypothetical protein